MTTVQEVRVPDIGDFKDVPIIEVLVKPGDPVKVEDPLITLESDKATMDVPSPAAGTVKEVKVKVGDKVSEGTLVLTLEVASAQEAAQPSQAAPQASAANEARSAAAAPSVPPAREAFAPRESVPAPAVAPRQPPVAASEAPPRLDEAGFHKAHASPAVRRFARELGVDLSQVKGSGPKGRILKEDVQAFVKQALAQPAVGAGFRFGLPDWPQVDFSKFGPVEIRPLSRIKKISGANLHRNWVAIPHVTQHEEADITELEAFRKQMAEEAQKEGVRLTLLAFLLKASVAALKKYPEFNSSLTAEGDALVIKGYYHIGVAVDTPEGLVVPVIRDVDRKGVLALARELAELSARAREKKLAPTDMQGGCFSISSLGGIGGTGFTPIINAPEVAILGVSRAAWKPVYQDGQFVPRLLLPLSLSYDHRVIDGAAAARFITTLAEVLSDIRRLVL
ncbi:dihydrolipoyllysine-residue acetyltransferase [Pelomicrobium sp.]|jgi:pyruvate dehydrogenase E2 component (dihydrolipoamide acetyltransferase)|uniref:dihydrolipoyllysine-residue acetyltransferase n=1 Tax=Pelomicrobium sp. TaxID=2815319 RepID=UPI002FDEC286